MPCVLRNLSIRSMDFAEAALDIESSLRISILRSDIVAITFKARSALMNLDISGKACDQWSSPNHGAPSKPQSNSQSESNQNQSQCQNQHFQSQLWSPSQSWWASSSLASWTIAKRLALARTPGGTLASLHPAAFLTARHDGVLILKSDI